MAKKLVGVEVSGYTNVTLNEAKNELRFHEKGVQNNGAWIPDVNLMLLGSQIKELRDFLNEQLPPELDSTVVTDLIETAKIGIRTIRLAAEPIITSETPLYIREQVIRNAIEAMGKTLERAGVKFEDI